MSTWELIHESQKIMVKAETWLEALPRALAHSGQDPAMITRLQIDVQPGNRVHIRDMQEGTTMLLQPAKDTGNVPLDCSIFSAPPDLLPDDIETESASPPPPRPPPAPPRPPHSTHTAPSAPWRPSPPRSPTLPSSGKTPASPGAVSTRPHQSQAPADGATPTPRQQKPSPRRRQPRRHRLPTPRSPLTAIAAPIAPSLAQAATSRSRQVHPPGTRSPSSAKTSPTATTATPTAPPSPPTPPPEDTPEPPDASLAPAAPGLGRAAVPASSPALPPDSNAPQASPLLPRQPGQAHAPSAQPAPTSSHTAAPEISVPAPTPQARLSSPQVSTPQPDRSDKAHSPATPPAPPPGIRTTVPGTATTSHQKLPIHPKPTTGAKPTEAQQTSEPPTRAKPTETQQTSEPPTRAKPTETQQTSEPEICVVEPTGLDPQPELIESDPEPGISEPQLWWAPAASQTASPEAIVEEPQQQPEPEPSAEEPTDDPTLSELLETDDRQLPSSEIITLDTEDMETFEDAPSPPPSSLPSAPDKGRQPHPRKPRSKSTRCHRIYLPPPPRNDFHPASVKINRTWMIFWTFPFRKPAPLKIPTNGSSIPAWP